jgi:predicted ATPase with chaperone activity
VVAHRNAAEAGVVPGIDAVGVESLRHWGQLLTGATVEDQSESESESAGHDPSGGGDTSPDVDLADVLGQPEAVAALEVAAVGGHHLSRVGRPGVGKTLLAERLPTILPDLGDDDALTRDVEQQAERIDAQDKAIETVRRDQVGQYRWVASEVSKQSRALAKIAERVGADVDVAVEPYQSGGM